jgi:hypothetical protein
VGEGREQNRTFLLGVGAENAGTSWLHLYLRESPEFAAGYLEEYHVFDTLDLESEIGSRDRIFTLAETAVTDLREGRPADAAALHRMSMYGNPAYYYDYFAALLGREPGRHVTADLTPAYALLSVERFREIRQEFADRGVRAAAVFLMRDPVDRIWSQLRMQQHREPGNRSAEERLLEEYAEPHYAARSDYPSTIKALDEAFGDDVHYEFYERLSTPEAVASLCRTVGIAMHAPELVPPRDEASAEADLPESTRRTVAAYLREVYRRVGERFPEVDLGALWPSARFVR